MHMQSRLVPFRPVFEVLDISAGSAGQDSKPERGAFEQFLCEEMI